MKTNTTTMLSSCQLGFFELPLIHLPELIRSPEGSEMVDAKCHHCDTILRCTRLVSAFVACDPCIARKQHEQMLDACRHYWAKVCPPLFMETKTTHPGFPRERWARIKALPLDQSLFICGPSGQFKTRMAFLRLQHAVNAGMSVKVIWPEKLEHFKGFASETRMEALADFGMILLDDPLLTACRSANLADGLKHMIDLLMRFKIPFIITSQVGESDFLSGNSYGEMKAAEKERGSAIMRRIKECCTIVAT
jgi:hypothetical protein